MLLVWRGMFLLVMRYIYLTGNRGLLFEVGDAVAGLELTEATPGYRRQIVPNASSSFGFWSKEGQPFRYVVGKAGVHIKSIFTKLVKLGYGWKRQLDFQGRIYHSNQFNNRIWGVFQPLLVMLAIRRSFVDSNSTIDQYVKFIVFKILQSDLGKWLHVAILSLKGQETWWSAE